jgi:hypothetical protein
VTHGLVFAFLLIRELSDRNPVDRRLESEFSKNEGATLESRPVGVEFIWAEARPLLDFLRA